MILRHSGLAPTVVVVLALAPDGALSRAEAGPEVRPVRTLALCSVDVPARIEDPQPVKALFERLVAERLEAYGLAILPVTDCDRAWKDAVGRVGGLYDRVTGERVAAREEDARLAALTDLSVRSDADGWVRAALVVTPAEYVRGKASWDGATETARVAGGTGTLDALTLAVRIDGLDGRPLHVGRGGVQLLAKYSTWGNKRGEVPRADLFSDPGVNTRSVVLALGPFLETLRRGAPPRVEPPPPLHVPATVAAPTEAAPTPVASGKGVALTPLRATMPGAQDEERRAAALFTELVSREVAAAGFDVVPPDVYERIWRRRAEEAGGVYDPFTGARDDGRHAAVEAATREEIVATTGARTLLRPILLAVPVPFFNETAAWDGTTDRVTEMGTLKKILVQASGTVAGLSLAITVESAEGRKICWGSGGIELLMKYEGGRLVPVPHEALFRDADRNLAAVRRALACFLESPE